MNKSNIYKRCCFPSEIIQHAVWLYYRFNPSHRDIEDLLAEQGISVTYESIRLWCNKFGSKYAARLRSEHLYIVCSIWAVIWSAQRLIDFSDCVLLCLGKMQWIFRRQLVGFYWYKEVNLSVPTLAASRIFCTHTPCSLSLPWERDSVRNIVRGRGELTGCDIVGHSWEQRTIFLKCT